MDDLIPKMVILEDKHWVDRSALLKVEHINPPCSPPTFKSGLFACSLGKFIEQLRSLGHTEVRPSAPQFRKGAQRVNPLRIRVPWNTASPTSARRRDPTRLACVLFHSTAAHGLACSGSPPICYGPVSYFSASAGAITSVPAISTDNVTPQV